MGATADKLVLTDSKGEKSYYRAKAMRWRCSIVKVNRLNRSSTYAGSGTIQFTHDADDSAGHVFYMADAATFTDCATGKRFMERITQSWSVATWLRAVTVKNGVTVSRRSLYA